MTDLMKGNSEMQMTSRDIAELTGKRHADVLRTIKKEVELLGEINGSIFASVKYVNKKGEKRAQYTFGKKGGMNSKKF